MAQFNTIMSRERLNTRVLDTLKELETLFDDKNEEYGSEDGLANFTTGGKLMQPYEDDDNCRHEALKAYMAKHVAQVYNFTIDEKDTRTNWKDIAVYALIAIAMQDQYQEVAEVWRRNLDKS